MSPEEMLRWAASKIAEAREAGDFTAFQNYERIFELWEKRLNEQREKESSNRTVQ